MRDLCILEFFGFVGYADVYADYVLSCGAVPGWGRIKRIEGVVGSVDVIEVEDLCLMYCVKNETFPTCSIFECRSWKVYVKVKSRVSSYLMLSLGARQVSGGYYFGIALFRRLLGYGIFDLRSVPLGGMCVFRKVDRSGSARMEIEGTIRMDYDPFLRVGRLSKELRASGLSEVFFRYYVERISARASLFLHPLVVSGLFRSLGLMWGSREGVV